MARGGFSRLRIAAAAGVAGATLVPAVAGPALAAGTAPLPYTKYTTGARITGPYIFGQQGTWPVANSVTTAGSLKGFGIKGAGGASYICAFSGCTPVAITPSVYAEFGVLSVNGVAYQDPDGVVLIDGPTLQADKKTVGGLATSMRYDFMGEHILRILVTLKNPKPKKVTKTVKFTAGLSSGASTVIDDDTDHDITFETTDSWIDTSNGSSPRVNIARGDHNGAAITDPVGTGTYADTFTLHIGPKKTVRLLYYTRFSAPSAPVRDSSDFDDPNTLYHRDLLTGLSASERKFVVNWTALPPPGSP